MSTVAESTDEADSGELARVQLGEKGMVYNWNSYEKNLIVQQSF